jgi:cephalosporin hydroxylase
MPPQFFADRPWDVGNNPQTATRQWLSMNADFSVDRIMESRLMVTVAPDGFLKRTA